MTYIVRFEGRAGFPVFGRILGTTSGNRHRVEWPDGSRSFLSARQVFPVATWRPGDRFAFHSENPEELIELAGRAGWAMLDKDFQRFREWAAVH